MRKFVYPMLLLIALSGCATPARVDQMSARNIDTAKLAQDSPLKHNLALNGVGGGEKTNPMWLSKVGGDEFKQALEHSLRTALLLASDQSQSRYVLNTTLKGLDQPFMGFDLKVTATVEYSLEERATGKKVYSKTIATPYTATFGDSVLAAERLKLANEGAVRMNIEKVIDELLSLNLAVQQVSIK